MDHNAHSIGSDRARPGGLASAARRRLSIGTALGACLAAWPIAGHSRAEPIRLRESRPLMGTLVDIAAVAHDPEQLKAAQAAAFTRMRRLVDMMSHYEPTSRVAAINLAAGLQPVPIEPELMQVLAMARDVSQRSSGAFDVTIGSVGRWHFDAQHPQMPPPGYIAAHLTDVGWRNLVLDGRAGTAYLTKRGMRIDLGGIAKLYILEAGLNTMRQHGIANALINGGGDVVAMSDASMRPWRVGIRDPRRPDALLAALDVREGFVASSGDYERFFVRGGRRYHHVLDPKTGYPTRGAHGVTLIGSDLASVNGLGAAAMVLDPPAARELVRGTRGVEALIAGSDGGLWMTGGMRQRLQTV
ncbi:MAG TPA: FAD:protein FMN transferase [Ramlibacter sp.]|nr:FAD:protein FMN transferase [Ramlibacter sp.]